MRRFVGWLLVLAVVFAALPQELLTAGAAEVEAALLDAPPDDCESGCPERLDETCTDGCLCTCCPTYLPAPLAGALVVERPYSDDTQWSPSRDSERRRRGFLDRVFHPPRHG